MACRRHTEQHARGTRAARQGTRLEGTSRWAHRPFGELGHASPCVGPWRRSRQSSPASRWRGATASWCCSRSRRSGRSCGRGRGVVCARCSSESASRCWAWRGVCWTGPWTSAWGSWARRALEAFCSPAGPSRCPCRRLCRCPSPCRCPRWAAPWPWPGCGMVAQYAAILDSPPAALARFLKATDSVGLAPLR